MKIKILFLFLFANMFSQELLNETFDNVSNFPYNGWEFVPDPSEYPPNTGEWRISTWSTDFNTSPPAPNASLKKVARDLLANDPFTQLNNIFCPIFSYH